MTDQNQKPADPEIKPETVEVDTTEAEHFYCVNFKCKISANEDLEQVDRLREDMSRSIVIALATVRKKYSQIYFSADWQVSHETIWETFY